MDPNQTYKFSRKQQRGHFVSHFHSFKMHARIFIFAFLSFSGFLLAFGQYQFPMFDANWREAIDPQRVDNATATTTTTRTTTTTTTATSLAEKIRKAGKTIEDLLEALLYALIAISSCVGAALAVYMQICGFLIKGRKRARGQVTSSDVESGLGQQDLAGSVSLTRPSQINTGLEASVSAEVANGNDSDSLPYFDAVDHL